MPLPQFLIIGAVKAGTTTLSEDLRSNPGIFLAPKEPVCFGDDHVLMAAGRRNYQARFDEARDDQLCGAVSVASASLPDVDGVACRARAVLGPTLKVIYMVRDPLARAVSHHLALVRAGEARLDVDRELLGRSCYADYSRYALQIEPWIQAFGPDNVAIVWFEKYVRERRATLDALSQWLGVPPRPDLVRPDIVCNRTADKLVMPWYGLPPGALKVARALVPGKAKELLHRWIPPRRARRREPSEATARRFRERMQDDLSRFYGIVGLDGPLWGASASAAPDSALLWSAGAAARDDREAEVVRPSAGSGTEPGSAQ